MLCYQVVDLESEDGGGLLGTVEGARLVEALEAGGADGGAVRQYVLVMTERQLLCLPLRHP